MQVTSVYREQILASFDVHPRLGKRSVKLGVPVLATVDAGEAVSAIFDRVFCAEQSNFHRLDFRMSSARYVQVQDV